LADFLLRDPLSSEQLKSAVPAIYEYWMTKKQEHGWDKALMPELKVSFWFV
jgi:hypothetical protein